MDCKYMWKNPGSPLPCGHYIKDAPGTPGFCKIPTQFRCIEAVKRACPSLSYTAASDWIQCREKYYLRNILGVRVKPDQKSEALVAGSAWDQLMQGRDVAWDSTYLWAKILSLHQAYKDLNITRDPGITQQRIDMEFANTVIKGYVDIDHGTYITEIKLSARPDFYHQLYNIHFQVGTYLMANEHWDHVVMEVTRLPGLRYAEDEDPVAYHDRCYMDIIRRPSYYFIGFNREKRTFGRKFYRSEFNFAEIANTYRSIMQEIPDAISNNRIYRNTFACLSPFPCDYLPIRKSGVISEEIYEYANKQPEEKEESEEGDA